MTADDSVTRALAVADAAAVETASRAAAVQALWIAERAVYLLRMNTHRGDDYRDAIEDADRVIRELIIAATTPDPTPRRQSPG